MRNLRQFFSYMHDVNFQYVVLRNFDNLPNDAQLGEHSDLDLLVYDFEHFFELFPEARLVHKVPRVRTRIPIGESCLYADVRSVGDDYYPESFQRAILRSREWNDRGFFTPDYACHTAALAYHAVHHKNDIAQEYRKYLGPVTVDELLDSLKASSIGWVEPKDKSVGRFNAYWKGATSVIKKTDFGVIKTQVSYHEYPLLANEEDILSRLNSRHFPKLIPQGEKYNPDAIAIENCGEHLTLDNIPDDWRAQLNRILDELQAHDIQHRDIKLDNLMVLDRTIKLIDFGWAITLKAQIFRGGKFELLEKSPPSCLGMPNKPSTGFDDEYSMRRVIKQIEYMLEEAVVCR